MTTDSEQGHARAQYSLGLMYYKGLGVPQDYKTAIKWYTRAAEQGFAKSQFKLGVMYRKGLGVPRDYKTAQKWYTLAAEQGLVSAAYDLGIMLEGSMYDGEVIAQDFKEAIRLYEFCIDRGHVPALVNLARMYSLGKGVPKDHKTSFKLYRLAAESGFSDASFNLGVKYANGTGVAIDYIVALMWMNIASRQNRYSSDRVYERTRKVKEQLMGVMSPADISAAQKLARQCVAKKYKGC